MTKTPPHFTHAHISGLWDARSSAWRALFALAIRHGADIIAVTEFTQNPLVAPDGWGKIHFPGRAGRNECAIFYRRDTWTSTDDWCIPISKTPYALGSGKIRPRVHLLGTELFHRETGKRVNFEVFHAPSAIEGRNSLIRGVRRARATLECFSAIRAHRKAELRGEASVLSADWNLNLRLPWVQALLRVQVRGFRSTWKRPLPKKGTHGKRIIDGPRISRKLRSFRSLGSQLGPHVRPFDHTMVITELAWR